MSFQVTFVGWAVGRRHPFLRGSSRSSHLAQRPITRRRAAVKSSIIACPVCPCRPVSLGCRPEPLPPPPPINQPLPPRPSWWRLEPEDFGGCLPVHGRFLLEELASGCHLASCP